MINFLFFTLVLLIASLRNFFKNDLERQVLSEILEKSCKTFFLLEVKNIYDCIILILPITIVFCLKNFNLKNIMDGSNRNIRYYDLRRSQKMIRFVLFIFFVGIAYIIKNVLDYFLVSLYSSHNSNIYNMINTALFYVMLAIIITVFLPYMYFKNDALLEFEYLNNETFEEINEKSDLSIISDVKQDFISPEKIYIKESNEKIGVEKTFDFKEDKKDDKDNDEFEKIKDEDEFEEIRDSPSPEKKEEFGKIKDN